MPGARPDRVLEALIAADGFDSPLGAMEEAEWRAYIATFTRRAGIRAGDSISEVGCGCGAFLYPFHEKGHPVGGIDYSDALIGLARSVMPGRAASFEVREASAYADHPRDDVVVANHVIHYFPSIAYTKDVVTRMLRRADRVAAVSGVPTAELRAESESARRGLLTPEAYEAKYRGLEILYFDKAWFAALAADHGFTAEFFEHEMPGFAQNPFRFDCVMTRTASRP